MTNNNNRSADDVIVYVPNGQSPVIALNLTKLAEEAKETHSCKCPLSGRKDSVSNNCICDVDVFNSGIEKFLSKIREAMR